jgi:nucleoside-diphosphate-sugar epimerase
LTVVILGADGFVGKNLYEDISGLFSTYRSTRDNTVAEEQYQAFYFDLLKPETWDILTSVNPDIVINCIGYGVVKNQTDVQQMIDVNYLYTVRLYEYIARHLPTSYLIHIGTAFEYDLQQNQMTEESRCTPLTYYGLSKYLTSNYLLQGQQLKKYSIIRPFNMFGPYEHVSKIVPTLITAQRLKTPVQLSEGLQKRDYIFVKDLCTLIIKLIKNPLLRQPVINAGSGRLLSLCELADKLSQHIEQFDTNLWQWGKLSYREGESPSFYNNSRLAESCGMLLTDYEKAFSITVNYYWNV